MDLVESPEKRKDMVELVPDIKPGIERDRCDQSSEPKRHFKLIQKADLVLVVGTSLQVQPFCLLPNLARNGATRVLVNRPLQDCFANSGRSTGYRWLSNICQVKSGNLWKSRQAKLVWNELFWDDDCDVFATKMLNQLKETSSSSSSTSTK